MSAGIGHNRPPEHRVGGSGPEPGQLLRDLERNKSPTMPKVPQYEGRDAVADWVRNNYHRLGQEPVAFMSARRLLGEIENEGGGPITSIDDPRLRSKLRYLERHRQLQKIAP
jgi:hypothetical protein